MKKRGIFFVVFALLVSLSFASASFDIEEYNLTTEYSPYEIIQGWVNITLEDELLDANVSSSLEQSILLKEFLDANNADYECTFDCENGYETLGSGGMVKTFSYNGVGKKYFGFYIEGQNVEIEGVEFKVSSDFGREDEIPLALQFFEESAWQFLKASDDYTRSESWGCFDRIATPMLGEIGSSPYCEKISIPESGSLLIGADIVDNEPDPIDLEMVVYEWGSLYELDSCVFEPYNGEGSCIVGGGYEGGEYAVCVKIADSESETSSGYKIKSEITGEKCGWLGLPSSEISTRDFAIFVKTPRYSAAEDIDVDNDKDEFGVIADDADRYIEEKYNRDCSVGCVLPISYEGVDQEFTISNVSLKYRTDIISTENEVYDLEVIEPTLDFSGILYLNGTGFDVGTAGDKDFTIALDSFELIEEAIVVLPAPIIFGVVPTNPAGGVPIIFKALVAGENITSYHWDFGEGTKMTTPNNTVVYTYKELGPFTLTLNVTDGGGLKTSKDISIIVGSPEDALEKLLPAKKAALNKTRYEISRFPLWQQTEIKKIVDVDLYGTELNRLERAWNNSFSSDDFLDISIELYELNVPYAVFVSKSLTSPLLTDLNKINPEPVKLIGGGSMINFEDYKNPILQWQTSNIVSTVYVEEISVLDEAANAEVIITAYSVDVKSNAGIESYFVIQKNRDDLVFKAEDTDIKKQGGAAIVLLDSGEEKSFEFLYEGQEELVMYVSSKLGLLPVDAIVKDCDYDFVCEEGENYRTCGSDCKPWGRMILYVVFAIIFGLVFYTILQVWYKSRYENSLFKDRNALYNLVMFITNAQARGMGDNEIRGVLKKQSWTGEQIVYALRKSRGQRTGMFEIIPIERLMAYFRKKKVEKSLAVGNNSFQVGTQQPIGINRQ